MNKFDNINIQDISGNDSSYGDLKEKLNQVEEFPTFFVFKFIVPSASDAKEKIEKIFSHPSVKLHTKQSSGGKYESLTIEVFVNTADDVINYYKQVGTIEKVIML